MPTTRLTINSKLLVCAIGRSSYKNMVFCELCPARTPVSGNSVLSRAPTLQATSHSSICYVLSIHQSNVRRQTSKKWRQNLGSDERHFLLAYITSLWVQPMGFCSLGLCLLHGNMWLYTEVTLPIASWQHHDSPFQTLTQDFKFSRCCKVSLTARFFHEMVSSAFSFGFVICWCAKAYEVWEMLNEVL